MNNGAVSQDLLNQASADWIQTWDRLFMNIGKSS